VTIPKIMSLGLDDPQCRAQLLDFSVVRDGLSYRALPREVLGREVIFELKEEKNFESTPSLSVWFRSLRALSLTATFLPCVSVILYAIIAGYAVDWFVAIGATIAAVFFQIAVNLLNDYEDYLKLIDLPGSLGGSGVLTQGLIRAKTLKSVALLFLLSGAIFGIPAVLAHPKSILLIGGVGVLGVLGYSGSPFRLKYVALGDFSVFLLMGPLLTLGISVASTGVWGLNTLLLGASFGFAAAAILHANNMQDIFSDTNSGSKTLASKLGFKASRFLLLAYYVFAYGCLIAGYLLHQMGWEIFLCLVLTLVLSFTVVKRAFLASGPLSPQLGLIRILSAQTHFAIGVSLILGLLVRSLSLL
jgi:1,4-dihydroxy-2-naphthoate polyprenyltransferase